MTPLVRVDALTVCDRSGRPVLDDVTVQVATGESIALAGPSGAGKTTLALALLGHLRPGLHVAAGSIHIDGQPVLGLPARELRALRARVLGHVPQDPLAALTPTMRVATLLAEAARAARTTSGSAGPPELLRLVGLPTDAGFSRRYPHQLSGGQRQRLTIALALAGSPALLILDEPTAGQDGDTREALLDGLVRLKASTGVSVVMVTHDPYAAARLTDRVVRIQSGRLDHGDAPTDPGQASAQLPSMRPMTRTSGDRPLLYAHRIHARYPSGPEVLHGIDLQLAAGECVAILGRSGSGKTTLARVLAGLHPDHDGDVRLDNIPLAPALRARTPELRRRIGIVFQDPASSLNPAHRVASIVAGATRLDRLAARAEADRLLASVGLTTRHGQQRPAALSGGELQRAAIARALARRPDLLICDEITSALDNPTRDRICALLDKLRTDLGLTLLIITHDPDVARRLAHRAVTLTAGAITTVGTTGPTAPALTEPVSRSLVP